MREKRPPCPLANTHRRLQDLHRLWHQTLESYSDPDGFRVNLNAAIEAARNVTFMLQSEKAAIPEFDRWYASEQEALRSDELMTWLRDARNTVVKQADLETTSTAVALVHDNLDFARWKMTVPPVVPTEAIAMALVKSAPPEVRQMLPYFIVSVERTWMATSLPDRELLDALAHAYSKLLGIVIAAHDRTATDIGSCSLASPVHAAESTAEVPACMRVTRESRTVRVTLQDQRPLTTGVQAVPYDEKLGEEQTKRYKTKKLHFNIDEEPDAEIIGERMVEFANRVLVRDRYHERITFVRAEGKRWKPITILARD